jgi:SHS2 domain-containing protein
MAESYEILEHTADIGFRAWGPTAAELFRIAACALMAIAAGGLFVSDIEQHAVEVTGHDYESLMVNWLEEVLYLFDSGRFAADNFIVTEITPEFLRAHLLGEPRDPARHPWRLIVKAITYHQIEVVERDGRWEARVFVDI